MNVIITGASRGIGCGIAIVLAKRGHRVGLLARSADQLADVARAITDAGGVAHHTTADLRDHSSVTTAIATLTDRLGGVDVLVNNAALINRKLAVDISLDDWHAMIETNVHGPFYAARAVLPAMINRGSGHIVNISSISGYMPLPGGSGYAASKYALTGFSESLFQEVREHGVKVTTVFPGSVDSESHRHDPREDHSWKVTPEEVGDAVASVIETRQGNLVSKLEIRPLGRPPKR